MSSTPRPEQAKDDEDAGRQHGTAVLFTLDEAGPKRLQENIAKDFAERAAAAAIAHMKTLSLQEAMWWFLENVPEDSPARTDCYFALRHRRANEAR